MLFKFLAVIFLSMSDPIILLVSGHIDNFGNIPNVELFSPGKYCAKSAAMNALWKNMLPVYSGSWIQALTFTEPIKSTYINLIYLLCNLLLFNNLNMEWLLHQRREIEFSHTFCRWKMSPKGLLFLVPFL